MVFASCAREPKKTVIARVGDAELTLERAMTHIDTTRGAIGVQLRAYATTWATTEVLYREAQRAGIESSPEFQQQLDDVRRQLVTERYLSTALAESSKFVGPDSMKSYYAAHAKEFLLRENMLKLNIMICATREQATNFAARVVQRSSWSTAAKEVTGDSSGERGPYSDLSPRYYSQSTLYPVELWRVATSLGANEVSFPVHSADRYYVLQLLATAQQGKQAEYEIVEDEVRQRILVEQRRKEYADLLGTLRGRYAVEILLNGTVPTDTLQGSTHE
jgi:hypothetical protein